MLDFSPEKMIFIFLIVMIVLGPEKLPEVSRKIGKAMGELRKLSGGFHDEMNKAMHEMTADQAGSGQTRSSQANHDQAASNGASAPEEITPRSTAPSGTDDATGN